MRRRQTITQQYSPTFRRRLSRTFLDPQSPLKHINSGRESIRSKQKGQMKESNEVAIKSQQHFSNFIDNNIKINKIIDQVDMIMRNRMNAHEQGLLSVVKRQIQNMQYQCRKIVQQYNDMINKKSKQSEIDNLRNQLDYFRTSALNYYQMYNKIIKENQKLKNQIEQKDQIIEQLSCALNKTTKKYMKQKAMYNIHTQRKNKAHYFINNIHTGEQLVQKNNQQTKKQQNTTQLLTKFKTKNTGNQQKTNKLINIRKMSQQNDQQSDGMRLKTYSQSQPRSHKFTNSKSYNRTNMSTDMGCKIQQINKNQVVKVLRVKTEEGVQTPKERIQNFKRSRCRKNERLIQRHRYKDSNQQSPQVTRQKVNRTQILSKQKTTDYIDNHLTHTQKEQDQRTKIKEQNRQRSSSFWRFNQNFEDINQKRNPWIIYC